MNGLGVGLDYPLLSSPVLAGRGFVFVVLLSIPGRAGLGLHVMNHCSIANQQSKLGRNRTCQSSQLALSSTLQRACFHPEELAAVLSPLTGTVVWSQDLKGIAHGLPTRARGSV